jgi:glycosyltransferase involved in cell wall biosynthesis
MHSTEWGRNGNNSGNGGSAEISHREWLGGYESSIIIATTPWMKDELRQIYSIPDDKILVIPNGIVKEKISRKLDPGRVKERYGLHPLAPVVLFCGRMSYQKGPDILVEAIPHVLRARWDVKFLFVGDGGMRSYCEQRTRELNINDSCRFLGYTSNAEKEELMNACDLVCVPSRNEPFGIVVLEAWAASKPIVATEAVPLVKNFKDGLLAYVQPESIAWCINHMLIKPDEMKKLGREGHKRINAEFDWGRIANFTESAYKRVFKIDPDFSVCNTEVDSVEERWWMPVSHRVAELVS